MGSLGYVCVAFCLVQITTLIDARPEFGTNLAFSFSADVSAVAGQVSTLLATVDDGLSFPLSGLIPGTADQQTLLGNFAAELSTKGLGVSVLLEGAVSSTAGVAATFDPLLAAYQALVDFLTTNTESFLGAVLLEFGPLLSEELYDSLEYFADGFQPFRVALEELRDALAVATVPDDVAETLFRELLLTTNALRSHLPVVVYVFQRAGVNLQAADTFYAAYDTSVTTMENAFTSDLSGYRADGDAFAQFFANRLDDVSEVYVAVNTPLVAGLSSVSSSPSYAALSASLDVFFGEGVSALGLLVEGAVPTAVGTMHDALEAMMGPTYFSGAEVFAAADALVAGVIESDVFAEYCFAKFRLLVADVPVLGDMHLHECLETEEPRRQKLRRVVRSFARLLSYDVEDLWANLETCAVRPRSDQDACLADLTPFYVALGTEHLFKYTALQRLVEAELAATGLRLQICLRAADYYTFDNAVASMVSGLEACFGGYGCLRGSCESSEEVTP